MKEVDTDYWVRNMLVLEDIKFDAQGSDILEIKKALSTASKNGKGNPGFPEFTCVVKDYVIVIENKSSTKNHVKKNAEESFSRDAKSIQQYAVNGAIHYGEKIIEGTNFKKVFAIGISGGEIHHRITPVFLDDNKNSFILNELESLASLNENNIDEYYLREVLNEVTSDEKETKEILKDAEILHEHLRNYGNLKDTDKPLVVSGILLALREIEFRSFSIDNLSGDEITTDGSKIYDAIKANINRSNVKPETKKDIILNQFNLIKDTTILNTYNETLGKTPLKFYTEFLYERIFKNIIAYSSSEDYIGRFYGEFMSYSGGDSQSLGIVLTPKHITDLFCELVDIKSNDIVLDPTCGTGGFLISAMHHMITRSKSQSEVTNIKLKQLFGYELQSYMFTIATSNMILRGDGKSNLLNRDFLKEKASDIQLNQPTIGMINPPYSQGSSNNVDLYEMNFIKHLLDSVVKGGKVIGIVPKSSMTGKTKDEQGIKEVILKSNTLEGVITLNPGTFYGVGVHPCICIFTAGIPHSEEKIVKFINYEDDGFVTAPHIGLLETAIAKDRKKNLLDVWFDRKKSNTTFCVESKVKASDDWLHSYYYYNDIIPTEEDYERKIAEFNTFKAKSAYNKLGLFEEEND